MEQIDMIERLREKTDLSYDEARELLQACNWNLLDALVALEKEGKLKEKKSMDYTTKHDYYNEYNSGNTIEKRPTSAGEAVKKVFAWIKSVIIKGMNNNFVVITDEGKSVEMPIAIMILILACAFWIAVIALIIAFFCGCSFRFSGPDLGNDKYNSFMEKIKFTSSGTKKNENNGFGKDDINDIK